MPSDGGHTQERADHTHQIGVRAAEMRAEGRPDGVRTLRRGNVQDARGMAMYRVWVQDRLLWVVMVPGSGSMFERRTGTGAGNLQRSRYRRRRFFFLRLLENLHHHLVRHHVDGVVVGRAAELANLRRGRIAERDAQSAPDAEVSTHGANHTAVPILLLDDATGDGTGSLANRAGERAEAPIGVDY